VVSDKDQEASADIASQSLNEEPCGMTTSEADHLKQIFYDGIDALPSGFAIFDANERMVLANAAYRTMVPEHAKACEDGMTFPEAARRTAIEHFGVAEEEANNWLERRQAYRKNPVGHFDQQLKDGRWFRIQERRTSDGGTVTNWTDITDLKKQEQVSEKYADELMITNQHLDEFARAASHDLQEPLRKIEVFGGRLSDKCGAELSESGTQYLGRIINATGRMRRLINALLDFSQSTHSGNVFAPVDLNEVADETLVNLELQVQDSDAQITVATLPTINGDFDQLARLFQNVLSNAIKYVAPGTQPHVEIEVVSTDQDHIVIAIRDNGIGFDQSDAEKIFEPFQRLHGRNDQYEGTGIGLASCSKIVAQHNGTIRADSIPGEGSTFTVTLARNAVAAETDLTSAA